jgi:hypothetical protein
MIKVVKLKRATLNRLPEELLELLGLVEGNRAFPERLYLSRADSSTLRKYLKRTVKKGSKNAPAKYLQYVEGMHWLNYGPNESLDRAIKPGYALIDLKTIKIEGETEHD